MAVAATALEHARAGGVVAAAGGLRRPVRDLALGGLRTLAAGGEKTAATGATPDPHAAPRGAALLDALGTLIALEPPWPAFVAQLRARHGIELALDDAESALRAEIAFYRVHHDAGRDRASLEELRRRCAAVLREALPEPARSLELADVTAALLASLRFVAYPEAPTALAALRARRLRLVVVSNWDVSLHDVLAGAGITALVDAVLTSAQVGSSKPAPAIFAAALELAGVPAQRALHVGDSVEHDVAGARAAGIAAVLVARGDGARAPDRVLPGVATIASLAELPRLADELVAPGP